ncbi:Brp/Blh family beta-carotene 15,15'-dioxygenase [Flagellimonas meridianipacifica]|uniref:Probable beta-carotene 15,15'-dioxygenase n=1 Tax=Flagellimonas meridianipacifica TaxID=1080225 RepID=A0A2T0M8I9_9FLAO|nr:Brp/Blh family beta-carotene 15,15'-dioxygenase [Allomuricauda pacifica]PRX53742.1 Brp/Blh family beta-carotene 15,15'-monooxygenase [Allomuricauda pacifica]
MIQQKTLNFAKLKGSMIVVTVFALWFSVFFDDYVETVLSYVLIMSFGVLHGANDIRLIQSVTSNNSKSAFIRVVLAYVLVVAGILTLFFVLPVLALGLFVLISGYHFGEQHWSKSLLVHSSWNVLFYTFYGLFILFMIFYLKSEQVIPILEGILKISVVTEVLGYTLLFSGFSLLVFGIFYYNKGLVKSNLWEELFVLLVFFVIFKTASLLWGFCIYFIVWHSIPSLKDQMDYLYGESSWRTFGKYIKDSILYWAVSIIGLLMLLWFLKDSSENMVAILIYFLAAITFPHVFVMSKLEKRP